MHGKWTRLSTLILCLTVILTPLPTGAENIGPTIISADEVVEYPEPSQEALPAETADIFTEGAQDEAASSAADDALDGEDSGTVDAEETPQPQVGADEGEVPSYTDEALSTDETSTPQPEADVVAAEFAQRWVDVLDVKSQQDEYHKALLLYDSLIYNYTTGSAASAVDALTQRSASATGYALSYELLLQTVGIDCLTVFEGEYAWNLARLDGAWTHIDVYADDVPEHYGFHFGLTDAAMAREHHWEGLPVSTDTQLNYFVREKNYTAFTGSEDLSALLSAAIDAQADTISLYSAGDAVDIAQVLSELDPGVDGSMSTSGLYTTIHFNWVKPAPTVESPEETEHPIVSEQTDSSPEDAMPEPEALPTATAQSDWPIVDGTGEVEADWPVVDESGDEEADWPLVDETEDDETDWPLVDGTGDTPANDTADVETSEALADDTQADQDLNLLEATDLQAVSTVSDAVEPTSIVPADISIDIGLKESRSIADWKLFPEGAQGEVSYTSQSPKIAVVSDTGVVTGKKTGSTKLTLALKDDPEINCVVSVNVKNAPTSIAITSDRNVLGVGETMQAGYKLSKGSVGAVTFSIPEGEQRIATVTPEGLITAHNPGTFTLNAETYNGKKAKAVKLEVKLAPMSVTLDKQSLSIGVGDSYTLGYTLSEGSAGKVSFTSDAPGVAAVDPDTGEIRAVALGSAKVKASAYGKAEATVQVDVIAAPNKVTLAALRDAIGIGEKLQLSSKLFTGDVAFAGEASTLKYASSKTSVATVDQNGVVTGKRVGTVNITVTAYNSTKDAPVTDSVKLTVQKAPTSVSMTGDRNVLGVGETMQVGYKLSKGSVGAVTFSIPEGEQGIATVTPEGLITAHNPGTFTLNAQTYNGKKAKGVKLEVKPAPKTVTLDRETLKIGLGDSYALSCSIDEGSAGKVTFESDNAAAVTVDPDTGAIKAEGIGRANVTASAYNDVTATVQVEVIAAPDKVTLEAPRDAIGTGEKLQLSSKLLTGEIPFKGEASTLTYASSKTSVATVDENGMVTGKKAGTVNITVTAYNSTKDAPVTDSIKLTVQKAPTGVSITGDRDVLGVGETMQLCATLSKGCAGGVMFTVPDDQNIGTVTTDGLFTACNIGKVDVTATTYNNKSRAVTIEVKKAPTKITIASSPKVLGVGASGQLTAQLTDPDSAGKLYYRVTNGKEFATIDETGKITANAVGKATLEVYTYVSGVVGITFLDVRKAPETLSLPETSINLGVGDSYTIAPVIDEGSAASFTYTTSKRDKAYASVSPEGVVTANKIGKSTINVTTHNELTAKLTVNVKAQPKTITVDPAELTLGVGESTKLNVTLSKNSAASLHFESEDSRVARVEPDGTVTARAVGNVDVNITTHNGLSTTCTISVVDAPKAINIDEPDVLGVGEQVPLEYTLVPEYAHTTPQWEIASQSRENVIAIKDDMLCALAAGTATLRCTSHVEGIVDELEIRVFSAPTGISFEQDEYYVDINDTFQLEPTFEPAGSSSELSYVIKDEGFFDIDENGLVTPIQCGSSLVKVTTYNDLSAVTTITVVDPDVPAEISFVQDPPVRMEIGESFTPELRVIPETANAKMSWTASSNAIVELDPLTGAIKAKTSGHVTIEGVSVANPKLTLSYGVTIGSDERCLIMPSQYMVTDPGRISSVYSQINDVRDSAYAELEELCDSGFISEDEMNARKNVITRAFEMYHFAWKPDAKMPYWKGANSEGGRKDFKTDYIYFGIPYTQSSRQSYPQWAINHGYYRDSNKGYYIMQTKKFASRQYPGSDCSSFVSMAVWGYNSSHRGDNTTRIASASYYKTLDKRYYQDLRPGDLLCYGGHHVVMFLYYANDAKTQFVIIEQGGGSGQYYQYCNTISTSIRDQSYYSKYKIRRVSSCDMTLQDRV